MPKKLDFNPTTGQLDLITMEGSIPEYSSDPTTPTPQTAWVLKTSSGGGGGGKILFFGGLGAPITTVGTPSFTYQLSYRTTENTTKRVTLA